MGIHGARRALAQEAQLMKLRVLLTLTVLAGVLPVLATACGEEEKAESTPAVSAPQPLTRLVIPKAKVDARIVALGLDANGVMQSPPNAYDVAWYDFSALPGAGWGNAVFAGMVDYHNVGPAVFWLLHELLAGDLIEVHLNDGTVYLYSVSAVNCIVTNGIADIQDVVRPTPSEVVTLITACGTWNTSTRQYDKHLIVRADRILLPPTQPPPTIPPLPTEPPATAVPDTVQADTIWSYCRQVWTTSESWWDRQMSQYYICREGKVFRCIYSGQNANPCSKLTSAQPLGLAEWCTTHPNDQQPPHSVGLLPYSTLHWGCKDGMPIGVPAPNFDSADFDEFGFYYGAWTWFPEPATTTP